MLEGAKNSFNIPKGDRALKVVRVTLGQEEGEGAGAGGVAVEGHDEKLVGVRYPVEVLEVRT